MPPKRVCGVPSNVTAPDSSAGLASEVGDSAEQRLAVDWSKCWRRRRPVMIHTYYDAPGLACGLSALNFSACKCPSSSSPASCILQAQTLRPPMT